MTGVQTCALPICMGDACDPCPAGATNTCTTDSDLDGVLNTVDNCIAKANALQTDTDLDGMGDACDPCLADATNTCSTDTDRDGVLNVSDNCIAVDNPLQTDTDLDGIGDACDICPTDALNVCNAGDVDGDGIQNNLEIGRAHV